MNGMRRFDDFRRHMGLSEAVPADRLRKLVAAGILDTLPYREPGSRTRSSILRLVSELGFPGLLVVGVLLADPGRRDEQNITAIGFFGKATGTINHH